MNTKLYRIKKRVLDFVHKKQVLTPMDEHIFNIAKKLITSLDTELYFNPLEWKYYLKSKKEKVYMSFQERNCKLVYDRTVFHYDVNISGYTANKIITLFNKVQQRRMRNMEADVLSGVVSSIKQLSDKLHE